MSGNAKAAVGLPPYASSMVPFNHVNYAPFSDESIQRSIDTLKSDEETMTKYIRKAGDGFLQEYSRSSTPREIQNLFEKYDLEFPVYREILNFKLQEIRNRVEKLKQYLEKSNNERERNSYPIRSYPNGEINIANIPREPLQSMVAIAPSFGGRNSRYRKSRRNKNRNRKNKSRRNRH
jgi:hypothetical protein